MLLDTGAAISIIHDKDPLNSSLSSGKPLNLQSFAGHNVESALSKPLTIQIGELSLKQPVALMCLPNETSLLGSDFLIPNGCMLDLTNLLLLQGAPTDQGSTIVIPDSHTIAAIKLNDSKYNILEIIKDHPEHQLLQPVIERQQGSFATHKHDCGKVNTVIHISGPDPPPQKQYPFPQEAISYIQETIDSLLDQKVIRP